MTSISMFIRIALLAADFQRPIPPQPAPPPGKIFSPEELANINAEQAATGATWITNNLQTPEEFTNTAAVKASQLPSVYVHEPSYLRPKGYTDSDFKASRAVTPDALMKRMMPSISAIMQPGYFAYEGYTYSNIDWNGGRVMHGTVSVYAIYYGRWGPDADVDTLSRFFEGNLGDHNDESTATENLHATLINELAWSNHFAINSTYFDSQGPVANHIRFGGSVYIRTAVDDLNVNIVSLLNIGQIVQQTIGAGQLPFDPNGIYIVFPSNLVQVPGACYGFCGLHTFAAINGHNIAIALIPNLSNCGDVNLTVSYCGIYPPNSNSYSGWGTPNNLLNGDLQVKVITHEVSEAVTDPDLNAWYQGPAVYGGEEENEDICNVRSLITEIKPAGIHTFGLQPNWLDEHGGYCTMGVPVSDWGGWQMQTATSNSAIWAPASATDFNFNTSYSSAQFPSDNPGWLYLAAYMRNGPRPVNAISLHARMANGVPLGFPQVYWVYVTDPTNSSWIPIGTYTAQPDQTGTVLIHLPSERLTVGVMVVAYRLGVDDHNNHYFQMAEVKMYP